MTPQEKANELFHKFYLVNSESIELETGEHELLFSLSQDDAKQCALIAVEEILTIRSVNQDSYLSTYYGKVKEEIDKL